MNNSIGFLLPSYLKVQFEKSNHSDFLIFQKNCKKMNKKRTYFGPLNANYRQFMWLFTLHCFSFLFSVCLAPYINICLCYFLILCFYFLLLFLFLFAKKNILQFKIFDLISLQPARNITKIKNVRKSVALIITKLNARI